MARDKFSRTLTTTNVLYVIVGIDEEGNATKSQEVEIALNGIFETKESIKKELAIENAFIIYSSIEKKTYELAIKDFLELATIVEVKQAK